MKAYIVEDDSSMRMILKRILKKNFPEISIFGESPSGEHALVELPQFGADLIIVDISLPGMSGLDMIERLKDICHGKCILVLTCHETDLYRDRALKAGARHIISKSEYDKLLDLIGNCVSKN